MTRSRKIGLLVLFIILGLAIIFRLPGIIYNNFPFTYDHGLTFLEVRDIALGNKFRLVGPEGGIKGIFFGPAWYYLLSIPFFFLGGDPKSGPLVSMIINLLCIPLSFLIGSKINLKTGILFSLFFAFSSFMISNSGNAFVVDAFPLINLLTLWLLLSSNKYLNLYLVVFWASLSFHFEPVVAVGLNLAIFYILYPKIKIQKFKNKILLLLIWVIPFIPQILFDLRHNLLQTSSIITALAKGGRDLGGTLPLWKRIIDRPLELFGHYHQFIGNGKIWLSIILIIYLILGIKSSLYSKNNYEKNLVRYCLILFIVPFLYYIFLFSPGIKDWYFISFTAIYGIFISLGFAYDIKNRFLKYLSFLMLSIFLLVNINPINTIKRLINDTPSNNPSSVRNELGAIEWIYKDAKGTPFVVYTYSPAVYDYPYQYLIWWYARKNNLSFPKDFSYQPKIIDYVPNKLSYTPPPEINDNFITYIIIHSYNSSTQFWTLEEFMKPFSGIPLISEITLDGNIKIQKRKLGELVN